MQRRDLLRAGKIIISTFIFVTATGVSRAADTIQEFSKNWIAFVISSLFLTPFVLYLARRDIDAIEKKTKKVAVIGTIVGLLLMFPISNLFYYQTGIVLAGVAILLFSAAAWIVSGLSGAAAVKKRKQSGTKKQ